MDFYTDLITDCAKELEEGSIITQKRIKDMTVSEITIDEYAEKLLGKRKGFYVTLEFKADNFDSETVTSLISGELQKLIAKVKAENIMVVGLGNETLTADKFGVLVSKKINVSQNSSAITVTSIAPSVEGLTGIDSKVILDLLIDQVKPQLIIMVDALMTKNLSRLISLVQISDTPLDFGRGTQLKRQILTDIVKNTAVISIGFPTTISTESILTERLEKINHPSAKKPTLLHHEYDNVVVAPAECDYLIYTMADVVSDAINNAIAIKM